MHPKSDPTSTQTHDLKTIHSTGHLNEVLALNDWDIVCCPQ